MRIALLRPPTTTAFLLVALAGGCGKSVGIATSEATPEKQFIFEGVRVEERGGADASWIGMAKRSSGDLAQADADGVHIRHFPQGPTSQAVDIYGPHGLLDFDQRKATLDTVRVVTPDQGVVTGGTAHYDGKAQRIFVDGPLDFVSPGLIMAATSGEMHLDDSTMDVAGPVTGHFESPSTPRRR